MKNATTFLNIFLFTTFTLLFTSISFPQTAEIYISDANNFNPPWKILKFDENGENPEIFIDTVLAWPQDILFLEDQQVVLISNLNTGRITKYNSTTGEYIGDFATGIGGPTRMKIGADSLLYVLQWGGNGKVKRYQLDGSFLDDFTSVGIAQSIGIDWDSDGNLYVSSYSGHSVRKFDQNGNDQGLFVNSNLAGPTNIWFDDTGDLLVTDYNGTAVKRFNSSGAFVSNFLTGLSQAEGVDFFPNGNILIGNGATHSIKMFDSNGNYLEDFIASGSGGLVTPNAILIREINVSSISDNDNSLKDESFILEQNYPNPFNPSTEIKYRLLVTGIVTLKVYNILGKEIATLINEELATGEHEVKFNATALPSGVYFYQLRVSALQSKDGKTDSYVETKKMTYLK